MIVITIILSLLLLDAAVHELLHRGPRCWRCFLKTDEFVLVNGLPMHKRCAERQS